MVVRRGVDATRVAAPAAVVVLDELLAPATGDQQIGVEVVRHEIDGDRAACLERQDPALVVARVGPQQRVAGGELAFDRLTDLDHALHPPKPAAGRIARCSRRSEEHTSELQSPCNLVCRLLLEKKKNIPKSNT